MLKYVKICLVSLVLLLATCQVTACGVPVPSLADVKAIEQTISAAADSLDSGLDVVERASSVSKFMTDDLCAMAGIDSPTCKVLKHTLAEVYDQTLKARGLIKVYRETGEQFNDALTAVEEAARKLDALKGTLAAITKSLA